MKVEITSRHFTPSDKLKEMVYDKLKKIEKKENSDKKVKKYGKKVLLYGCF